MTRFRPISVALAALVILAACRDVNEPPPGGAYVATLVSPNRAEGAAVIELEGAGIEALSERGGELFSETTGRTVRVVIVREAPGAIEFGVTMASGSRPPTARVIEVADGEDQLRDALDRYSLRFGR